MFARGIFVKARGGTDSAAAGAAPAELSLSPRTTSLLVASVLVVSAAIAFAAVRAWFAPLRAAAVIPARLSVDTQPAGAELLIDGQPRGRTPATFSIDPGAHTLTVRTGGAERVVPLTLAPARRSRSISISQPLRPPSRPDGSRSSPIRRACESLSTDNRAACRRWSSTVWLPPNTR
jgi:hypothetical protein